MRGQPTTVPEDGLTTRQRRNRPLAHRQHRRRQGEVDRRLRPRPARLEPGLVGRRVPVRQEREVAHRRADRGRDARRAAPRDRHGRPDGVAQDGRRLVVDPQGGHRGRPRRGGPSRGGRRSSAGSPPRRTRVYVLDEFTYPMVWGWIDVDDVVATLRDRPGHQHVVITGRRCPAGGARPRRPRDRDDEGEAPVRRRARRASGGSSGERLQQRGRRGGRRGARPPPGRAGQTGATVLPRLVVAAPGSGHGKTTVATGLMAALRARGAGRVGVQGRARLHRPRLPRARDGPPRPQPRPLPLRAGPRRAAAAARRGGARDDRRRRHRGRHGPLRRAHRRRRLRLDRARRDPHPHAGRARPRRQPHDPHRRRDRPRPRDLRARRSTWPGSCSTRRRRAGTCARSGRRSRPPASRCSACCRATTRHRGTVPPPRARAGRRARGGRPAVGSLAELVAEQRRPRRRARDRPVGPRARRPGVGPGRRPGGRARTQPRSGAPRPVVAVAGGRAFTFRYAETDELLRAAGLEPVVFDPLRRAVLPAGTCRPLPRRRLPRGPRRRRCPPTPRCARTSCDAVRGGLPTVAECAGHALPLRVRRRPRDGRRHAGRRRRWAHA